MIALLIALQVSTTHCSPDYAGGMNCTTNAPLTLPPVPDYYGQFIAPIQRQQEIDLRRQQIQLEQQAEDLRQTEAQQRGQAFANAQYQGQAAKVKLDKRALDFAYVQQLVNAGNCDFALRYGQAGDDPAVVERVQSLCAAKVTNNQGH